LQKQVRQQDTNPSYGGGQLKVCATPSLPFPRDGNISVADCMSVCNLLKAVKISGCRAASNADGI